VCYFEGVEELTVLDLARGNADDANKREGTKYCEFALHLMDHCFEWRVFHTFDNRFEAVFKQDREENEPNQSLEHILGVQTVVEPEYVVDFVVAYDSVPSIRGAQIDHIFGSDGIRVHETGNTYRGNNEHSFASATQPSVVIFVVGIMSVVFTQHFVPAARA
jgi:hypothetical protein